MPFLSPDWRCPGDQWLKSSESGSMWENAKIYRLRMFETMNENVVKRLCRQTLEDEMKSTSYVSDYLRAVFYQPYIHLQAGATREIATTTTISEALIKLDTKSALRDIRRFDYICKIVELLISEHFHRLTGRLQLFLIELLREALKQVQASCNQTERFRKLLDALKENLAKNEHDHIGSALLWQGHRKALDEMYTRIDEFDIEKKIQSLSTCPHYKLRSLSVRESSSVDHMALERLPTECLSHVLTYLNSPQDLETASVASSALASIVEDDHFWRTLTLTHFDISQIPTVNYGLPGWHTRSPMSINDCNWKRAYVRLLKIYGDNHIYPAKLAVCEICFCVFWPVSYKMNLLHAFYICI
ncbi:F-box only protein 25 [Schistosoma japonicum]|nr:F-box only protein 25 [Schistosoma japonicum]